MFHRLRTGTEALIVSWYEQENCFARRVAMDPVSALGLWGLSLLGIGALVYAARSETDHQRKLTSDEE